MRDWYANKTQVDADPTPSSFIATASIPTFAMPPLLTFETSLEGRAILAARRTYTSGYKTPTSFRNAGYPTPGGKTYPTSDEAQAFKSQKPVYANIQVCRLPGLQMLLRIFSPSFTAVLTLAISLLVFLASVSSQFWLGKAPCLLCLITRYCFLSIALLSAASLWKRKFRWISLAAVFLCFSFSFYHLGVESHWWAAPQSCAAELPTLDKLETVETLDSSKVYCDRANWLIFGISSTLWSFVIAAFLFWFASLSYVVNHCLRKLEDDD